MDSQLCAGVADIHRSGNVDLVIAGRRANVVSMDGGEVVDDLGAGKSGQQIVPVSDVNLAVIDIGIRSRANVGDPDGMPCATEARGERGADESRPAYNRDARHLSMFLDLRCKGAGAGGTLGTPPRAAHNDSMMYHTQSELGVRRSQSVGQVGFRRSRAR